jgi:hypothetical protein
LRSVFEVPDGRQNWGDDVLAGPFVCHPERGKTVIVVKRKKAATLDKVRQYTRRIELQAQRLAIVTSHFSLARRKNRLIVILREPASVGRRRSGGNS